MDQSLKVLFERALVDEPPPPPGELAREAMVSGRRRRRRRHLAMGGTAGVVVALATAVAVGLTTAERTTPAAMSVTALPACTQVATEVAVFLRPDITDDQRAGLDEWLRSDPRVRQVVYESKEVAYERFKQMYRDTPDLVAAVEPGNMRAWFRIEIGRDTQPLALRDDIQKRPGVETVVGLGCAGGHRAGEGE